MAILILSHCHHRTVGFQTHGMIASCTDGHDILPAADITLVIHIRPHSHHRAIGFQTHGVPACCTDGHDILPAADITLVIHIRPHSHHRAVGFQAYGLHCSRADGFPNRSSVPAFHTTLRGIQIIAGLTESDRCTGIVSRCQQLLRCGILCFHLFRLGLFRRIHSSLALRAENRKHDIRPAADIALAIIIVTHSHHGTVGFQTHCMIPSCTDSHNVPPRADIALTIIIISHCHHRAVGFQADCMVVSCTDSHNILPVVGVPLHIRIPNNYLRAVGFQAHSITPSCTDGHNILPVANIALAIIIFSHSHHRTVGFQTHGIIASRADCYNILPIADFTLVIIILSHCHHRAVGFQAHGMIASRADCYNILPIADFTLVMIIMSHSYHRTVGFQAHGMTGSCANSLPNRKGIPKIHTLLFGILIIAGLTKSDRRTGIVPGCQKALRFGEVGCRYSFGCVLILSQRSKSFCCVVKVSRGEKCFCLGVVSCQHPLRCVLIRSQSSKSFRRTGIVPGCQEFFCSLVVTSRNDDLCHQQCGNDYDCHCRCGNDRNGLILFLLCLFLLLRNLPLAFGFCVQPGLLFSNPLAAERSILLAVGIVIKPVQAFLGIMQFPNIGGCFCDSSPLLIVCLPAGTAVVVQPLRCLICLPEKGFILFLHILLCGGFRSFRFPHPVR